MLNKMELHNPAIRNKNSDLEVLCKSVNPIRLKNNPLSLSPVLISELYKKILIDNAKIQNIL